jgi:hypothetical protein
MITLGVDFASQSKNTAACFVLWKKGRAEVGGPRVTDEGLPQLFARANKVEMDVPFGWPTAFVQSVTAHAQRKQLPSFSTQQLRFRVTDHNVKLLTGKWPRQRPYRMRVLPCAWPDCRQHLPHNARAGITQTRRNTAVHLK